MTTPQAASTPTPTTTQEVARDKKFNRRIFKQGMLERRTDILKKWKPVYFVVREDKFCWYKDEKSASEGKKKTGGMNYTGALVDKEDEVEMKKQFVFSFNSRGKACFVACSNEAERDEWMLILKKVVKGQV